MAMEYYIDAECEMRKTAGGMDNLRLYIKKKGIVQTMVEILTAHDPKMDVLSQKTVYEERTPEGVRKTESTVGQMKAETDWMYQWSDYCAQCQYAFMMDEKERRELCGCYAAVSYPISAVAEGIVGAALNLACQQDKGHPIRRILDYIQERNVTGDAVANMRRNGMMERDKALAGKISTFKKVTTDQVLEVLFHHPKTPEVARDVLLPFLNIIFQLLEDAPDVKAVVMNDKCAFSLMGMAAAFQNALKAGKTVVTIP